MKKPNVSNEKLRIFFFSFAVQGGGAGDSVVLAVQAKGKDEAKEKFKAWVKKDGFEMEYVERFFENSVFEFDELTRDKICFNALGGPYPETESEKNKVKTEEEEQVEKFKEKAKKLFTEGKLEEAVKIFYNFEHIL